MSTTLSRRCETVIKSEIRAMSVECERAGGINLAQGVCDMPVPDLVRKAAQRAIDAGINSYTRHDGIGRLRQAIADKLRRRNGITADPETEIVVSAGSTGCFYSACLALLDPGDGVVLFEPYYGYHVNTLLAVEAVPSFVTMRAPDWGFSREDLREAIGPRTKAIVLNTPANPSGKVFSREELQWVAELAVENDLFLFTDEIYEFFLYDGASHISPATIPGLEDRTITISGVSKTFSITGWRIGYSACPERWARLIGYMNDLIYVCAPAPLQEGVAEGILGLDAGYYRALSAEFVGKRERICAALGAAGLPAAKPAGAYYVLADVSRLPGRTAKDRVMHLLKTTGVAAVPGEAFYHRSEDGYGLARFCYAKTDSDLDEACRRLKRLG